MILLNLTKGFCACVWLWLYNCNKVFMVVSKKHRKTAAQSCSNKIQLLAALNVSK